ncbi:MAG: alpha/beta fold hydrolase [Burkholderiales bacterium]|nr:alpha/beta fold hydrolase [Burkholderiales bacterium]
MANGPWVEHFPGNMVWSNACLVTKGMAPYGAVALGEIDEVCERLRARQDEPDAWREEWCALGARLEKVADAAEAAGHKMAAGNYYLRAGMYYFTGERFITPGEQKRETGRKAIELQNKGILRRYPYAEKVEVPFEGNAPERGAGPPGLGGCDRKGVCEPAASNPGASVSAPGSHPASGNPASPSAGTLPALFMKAPGVSGRAPTVVVFDGMDNCKEMSVLFAGLEFAARGWHTLAIDGPGQGESLRLRELYARHDYEAPGAAAYDYVSSRPDVDPEKVIVMGYSFGGYYAARVAAFEKRYAAGVAMSALHWDLAAWQAEIKRKQEANPKNTAQSTFHFRWIMGCIDDGNAAIEKAKKFSLAGVAEKISRPFLIVHGADDKVVPVANAHKLYEAIGSREKHLRILTAEDGGSYHAQADNRQVGIDYIADWIDTVIRDS